MSNEMILLIVMVVLVACVVPAWPYSRSWGYAPTGLLTVGIIVLLVYAMSNGRLPGNSPGQNLKSDVRSTGQDLKDMGRDAAEGIRNAVQ